jgi:hypothetical protein
MKRYSNFKIFIYIIVLAAAATTIIVIIIENFNLVPNLYIYYQWGYKSIN